MDETTKKAIIDEMNSIIRERQSTIGRNYLRVRDCYRKEYGLPELDPLRYEITLCLTFGLYQAAITLTNHLLESLLKYALIYHHALQKQQEQQRIEGHAVEALIEWLSEGKSLYADKNLDHTINRACTLGLITKEQKNKLHNIRQTFRNAYGHADKGKTFGEAAIPAEAVRFTGDQAVRDGKREVPLADLLIFQGVFQAIYAEKDAVPYYLFIDNLARQIIAKLFPYENQNENERT